LTLQNLNGVSLVTHYGPCLLQTVKEVSAMTWW
jgi:hypothetical protein